jgi:hypothetical protein
MRGFSGRTSEYSNIYRSLPETLHSIGATQIDYYRIGTSVEPLPGQMFYLAPSEVFYCPPRPPPRGLSDGEQQYFRSVCLDPKGHPTGFSQESRIDKAIARVVKEQAAGDLNLAIIITDLFVTAGELEVGYGTAFTGAVSGLLRQGMAVGVIGVEAAFDGTVFDLTSYPNASNSGPHHNGTRPFFMLVFGAPERIREFDEAISTMTRHRHSMALFRQFGGAVNMTGRPAQLSNVQPDGQRDSAVFEQFREIDDELRRLGDASKGIQRMTLPQPSSSPRWQKISAGIALPEEFRAADAPAGKTELVRKETLALTTGSDTSCGSRWSAMWNDEELPLIAATSSGQVTIFQDQSLAARFQRTTRSMGSVFLERAEVRWVPEPIRPGRRPPLPAWVNDFGFSPEDEAALLNRLRDDLLPTIGAASMAKLPAHTKGFFPALNLPELIEKLARVQQELLRPVDLGWVVVAWRFEN